MQIKTEMQRNLLKWYKYLDVIQAGPSAKKGCIFRLDENLSIHEFECTKKLL